MQRILDTCLLLFHFNFGRRANLDQRHTACQFGNTLLQFFLIVIGGRFLDLRTDLLDAGFNVSSDTRAIDNGRIFLGDFNALSLPQLVERGFFQCQANFLGDHLASRQNGDIFEHGLAAIAKAGRLDSTGLKDTAYIVDNQCRQRFTLNIFGNDQQRTACLGNLLKNRQ